MPRDNNANAETKWAALIPVVELLRVTETCPNSALEPVVMFRAI
jgi:hypothetical protein